MEIRPFVVDVAQAALDERALRKGGDGGYSAVLVACYARPRDPARRSRDRPVIRSGCRSEEESRWRARG